MRAAAYRSYGSPHVLRFEEIDTPSPGPGEVRVRIRAATVTSTDATFRRGDWAPRLAGGLLGPANPVLGTELSGVIDAVGEGVTRFRVGDPIYAATGDDFGAHAEYVCIPEDGAIAPRPEGLSFAEAAAICEGTLTALPFLRDHGELQEGRSVLINGASGAVGVAAVQIAKILGAEVTAVCSARNVDLVRSLGADHVIDYTSTDVTDLDQRYDVVFDVVGALSFPDARRILVEGGRYLCPVLSAGILWHSLWSSWFGSQRALIAFTGLRSGPDKNADLEQVARWVEEGRLQPVVQTFPFDRIAEAHALVDSGHKQGNAVVEMG